MDGENHGKPYLLMDDLGGKPHYFRKHPNKVVTDTASGWGSFHYLPSRFLPGFPDPEPHRSHLPATSLGMAWLMGEIHGMVGFPLKNIHEKIGVFHDFHHPLWGKTPYFLETPHIYIYTTKRVHMNPEFLRTFCGRNPNFYLLVSEKMLLFSLCWSKRWANGAPDGIRAHGSCCLRLTLLRFMRAKLHRNANRKKSIKWLPSWWFQPSWKILVKLAILPK